MIETRVKLEDKESDKGEGLCRLTRLVPGLQEKSTLPLRVGRQRARSQTLQPLDAEVVREEKSSHFHVSRPSK